MGIMTFFKNILTGNSVDYSALIAEGAVIVDVRTKEEFKFGHAKNSKNIPMSSLPGKINSLKGKTVILVCRSGARAGSARQMLQANGITAYNAGAWQNVQ
jgi:rhodanese-related sulfurtransferase